MSYPTAIRFSAIPATREQSGAVGHNGCSSVVPHSLEMPYGFEYVPNMADWDPPPSTANWCPSSQLPSEPQTVWDQQPAAWLPFAAPPTSTAAHGTGCIPDVSTPIAFGGRLPYTNGDEFGPSSIDATMLGPSHITPSSTPYDPDIESYFWVSNTHAHPEQPWQNALNLNPVGTVSTSSPGTLFSSPEQTAVESIPSPTSPKSKRSYHQTHRDTGRRKSARRPSQSSSEDVRFSGTRLFGFSGEASDRPPEGTAGSPDKRHRNRVAAMRYRHNQNTLAEELEAEEQTVSFQHEALSKYVSQLREEIYSLKNEVFRHSNCDCPLIQAYLSNAARRAQLPLAGVETHNTFPDVPQPHTQQCIGLVAGSTDC